jgi:hypothetical protein
MSKRGVLKNLRRCTRTSEPFDSRWECDYMLLLESESTIKQWSRCRTLRIPYTKADGSRGTYNPDFVVERTDGTKEIHEVKGTHLLPDADTQRKLAAGQVFCAKRGMLFKVITKRH